MGPIEELFLFDTNNSWPNVFMKIRIDAMTQHDYSLKASKKPEFKNRNRYGDVSPYDYSRICLTKNNIDYINASMVRYDAANRAYILTQGPLPSTSGHFWLMVWEQRSRAILMLNKIVEKGHIKCHQYYPTGHDGDNEMTFDDVGLKVTFKAELEANHEFTIRVFQLENIEMSKSMEVMQFHYIAWPDFGVPKSPSAFLDFLFAVRNFGVLDDPSQPPIIHCSAGIGRSGTFCLADTCLVLIEKEGTLENVRVLDTLMEMRRYRMGLIQTHEQLRFSYLAITEGASRIHCLTDSYNNQGIECDEEVTTDDNHHHGDDVNINSHVNHDLPPIPPRSVESLSDKTQPVALTTEEDAMDNNFARQNGRLPSEVVIPSNHESSDVIADTDSLITGPNNVPQELIKRRKHEERVKKTNEMIKRMKIKQQDSELKQSKFSLIVYGGVSLAVAFLGFAAYKFMHD